MRLVYNDPYALRVAVEQLAGQQPIATRRERDLPMPVDVYQPGHEIVIEGALPGGQGYQEVGVKSNRREARSK